MGYPSPADQPKRSDLAALLIAMIVGVVIFIAVFKAIVE
jgi:hypothetical protein